VIVSGAPAGAFGPFGLLEMGRLACSGPRPTRSSHQTSRSARLPRASAS